MQKLAYVAVQSKVYAELSFKRSTKTQKEVDAQIELEFTAFQSDLTEDWIPSPFDIKDEYHHDYDVYYEDDQEVEVVEHFPMINDEGRGRGGRGRGGGLNAGGIGRAGRAGGRGDGRGGREDDGDDGYLHAEAGRGRGGQGRGGRGRGGRGRGNSAIADILNLPQEQQLH